MGEFTSEVRRSFGKTLPAAKSVGVFFEFTAITQGSRSRGNPGLSYPKPGGLFVVGGWAITSGYQFLGGVI